MKEHSSSKLLLTNRWASKITLQAPGSVRVVTGSAQKVEDRKEREECGKSGKVYGIDGSSQPRGHLPIPRRLGRVMFWTGSPLVSMRSGVVGNTCTDDPLLGHILTRVVSKGATALGILHEYDLECQVLRSLLSQRVWRRGKRG